MEKCLFRHCNTEVINNESLICVDCSRLLKRSGARLAVKEGMALRNVYFEVKFNGEVLAVRLKCKDLIIAIGNFDDIKKLNKSLEAIVRYIEKRLVDVEDEFIFRIVNKFIANCNIEARKLKEEKGYDLYVSDHILTVIREEEILSVAMQNVY